jgi:hypothetical protein
MCCVRWASAAVNATEDDTQLIIENDRLYARASKASGKIDKLELDGENLLGTPSSSTGVLYLDCYWFVLKHRKGNDVTGLIKNQYTVGLLDTWKYAARV